MPRPSRSTLAALPLVALLAACGAQDATQGSVRDDVQEALLARTDNELSVEEAGAVGDCVARGMFESGDFTKEERDDATRAVDGDEPDAALREKVQALLERCLAGDDTDEGPGPASDEDAGEG